MEWTKSTVYPSSQEIDQWIDSLHQKVATLSYQKTDTGLSGVTPVFGNGHTTSYSQWWKFEVQGRHSFYAIWQPSLRSSAPVIIHTPGYGAETTTLPELVHAGYHVLHINPLGYMTPLGPNLSLKYKNEWPVLRNTVLGLPGGYEDWLIDAMIAIKEVLTRPDVMKDHLLIMGTSQGGNGAVLLSSIFTDLGVKAVVADVPFLTNFEKEHYAFWTTDLQPSELTHVHMNRIGYIDAMSHLHRLHAPLLLTAGAIDTACAPATIEQFYLHLKGSKSLNYLANQGHAYTRQAIHLAQAWFAIYG